MIKGALVAGLFIAIGIILIAFPIDRQPNAPLAFGDILPGAGAILAGVVLFGVITWSNFRRQPPSITSQLLDIAKSESRAPSSWYHRVILAFAVIFCVSTVILMVASAMRGGIEVWLAKLPGAVMFVVLGTCLGVTIACTFAPSSFFGGPTGQKWLDFIGTRNLLAARTVCVVLTIIIAVFFAFVIWAFFIHEPEQRTGQADSSGLAWARPMSRNRSNLYP